MIALLLLNTGLLIFEAMQIRRIKIILRNSQPGVDYMKTCMPEGL